MAKVVEHLPKQTRGPEFKVLYYQNKESDIMESGDSGSSK
jgi:hypothetical protein